jgi:primosomal protein N' (replication factor Y)
MAGRAGRGQIPGIVLVQTINPDHYAIQHAAAQDYQMFYEKEVRFRRAMRYPPFSALANILVRSEKQEEAMRMGAGAGGVEDSRPGGGACGAAEERVPLSTSGQSDKPQSTQ